MLSTTLKIAVLGLAIAFTGIAITTDTGGMIWVALAIASGSGFLLSKGLRTPLSSIEAAICVAVLAGFVLTALPATSCAPAAAALHWGLATLVSMAASVITAFRWRPRSTPAKALGSTGLFLGLSALFGAFAIIAIATTDCDDISVMPGLAAALIAFLCAFAMLPKAEKPDMTLSAE